MSTKDWYEKMLADIISQYASGATPVEPAAKPKPKPEGIPTISGSVIGYRAWRIRNWALTGTGVNRAWVPGVNEATCDTGTPEGMFMVNWGSLFGKHAAPGVGCHCGINALARFDDRDAHWVNSDVLGAIEAWSDDGMEHDDHGFVLHSTGFRARYGKVILLAVSDDYPRAQNAAIRALAADHGADVCKREHLEDAAKEHGQLVSDDLLAWAKEAEPQPVEPITYPAILPGSAWQWQITTTNNTNLWTPPVPKAPKREKGIKKTLKTNGPPTLGKWQKNDKVKDRRGSKWICVKPGEPGTWEPVEAQ